MLLLLLAASFLGLYLLPSALSQPHTFCFTHDCLENKNSESSSRTAAAESRELVKESLIPDYTILGKKVERVLLNTPLDDVHISIKTSDKLLDSRLSLLALTWLQTVPRKNVRQLLMLS